MNRSMWDDARGVSALMGGRAPVEVRAAPEAPGPRAFPVGETTPNPKPPPLVPLDPGWLFLVAGVGLIAATVLIPSFDQLGEAELARDRARVAQEHAAKRLENYSTYLDALHRGEPGLALSLAATQLNLAPADRQVLSVPGERAPDDVSPFPALEPPAPPMLYRIVPDTTLQRWTTDEGTRLWLLAAGAMCILIGLLPATVGRGRR